jgi:hypothetical protein
VARLLVATLLVCFVIFVLQERAGRRPAVPGVGWRDQRLALRLAVNVDATIASVANPISTGTGNASSHAIAAGVIAAQIIADAMGLAALSRSAQPNSSGWVTAMREKWLLPRKYVSGGFTISREICFNARCGVLLWVLGSNTRVLPLTRLSACNGRDDLDVAAC